MPAFRIAKEFFICKRFRRGSKPWTQMQDEERLAWNAVYHPIPEVSSPSFQRQRWCPGHALGLNSAVLLPAAAYFQCSISHHGYVRRHSLWCEAKRSAVCVKLRNPRSEVIKPNKSIYRVLTRFSSRMSRKGTEPLLHVPHSFPYNSNSWNHRSLCKSTSTSGSDPYLQCFAVK